METIKCLSQWARQFKIGDTKCALLPKGCLDTTLRSTISQFNRGTGQIEGRHLHMSYYWESRGVCVKCVSFSEYVEHKTDSVYAKNWRKQAKEVYDEELKKHNSARKETPWHPRGDLLRRATCKGVGYYTSCYQEAHCTWVYPSTQRRQTIVHTEKWVRELPQRSLTLN